MKKQPFEGKKATFGSIMAKVFASIAICVLFQFSCIAQQLPDLDFRIESRNYFEICNQLDAYFAEEKDPENQPECKDNEWVKYQRWKWFWNDRVQPDGTFPNLRAQWLDYQKHFAASVQNRDNQPVWENEGPTISPSNGLGYGLGRTQCLTFHPTDPLTFFVGADAGGVWKTTDGGLHYTPLDNGLPYLIISGILIDYEHPDTIYVSTGDRGVASVGVYRSTDGGNSWAPTGLNWQFIEGYAIYSMAMSPSNPAVLFVASNDGLLRSKDGGNTWEKILTGDYSDIKFRPGVNTTIYAVQNKNSNTGHIVKSVDGGETWTQIFEWDNGTYIYDIRLAVSEVASDWLAVHYSDGTHHFMLSKDGGYTFKENAAPSDNFGNFYLSATDSNIVYVGGVTFSRSLDQGLNWESITNWYFDGIHPVVHADMRNMVHNPHHPNALWVCNDGGVFRYDESSHLWKNFSNGLAITQFYRLAIGEGLEAKIAAGSQDNGGWFKTPNGGPSDWVLTNSGDAMSQIIDPSNDNIFYTEYYSGIQIYRYYYTFGPTVNIAQNIPGQPHGNWITPFILNPQNPQTFIVGFEDLFRSYDRGDHFHKMSDNLTGAPYIDLRDIAMSASDSNVIVATRANTIYKTDNGGQTWTSETVSTQQDITRIIIHPNNPQRMWVTKGGFYSGEKVFTTTDGWLSSQNISENLPNVPVNCILYDSATNYLLLGTDIGVFYSDADQIDWKPYGLGMPSVFVFDLKIRQATRKLYAATFGRGIYSVDLQPVVETNNPSSRTLEARVFPNPASNSLLFKSEPSQIFEGEIAMFNAMGRKVLSKRVNRQVLSDVVLDVAALPAGLYFLQAFNSQGLTVFREKVVIED